MVAEVCVWGGNVCCQGDGARASAEREGEKGNERVGRREGWLEGGNQRVGGVGGRRGREH
jgi:hypothetical protein